MPSRTLTVMVGLIVLLYGCVSLSSAAEASYRPDVETFSGVPHISGGVGQRERQAMSAKEKNYNLRLLFAARSGDYLSNVQVLITDQEGQKLLETQSEGPWVYVKLPPGQYHITAQSQDVPLHQEVQINPNSPTNLAFYWQGQG